VNNRANAFSQPANKRVNLSAHPVTPLANNASVAPGWPGDVPLSVESRR